MAHSWAHCSCLAEPLQRGEQERLGNNEEGHRNLGQDMKGLSSTAKGLVTHYESAAGDLEAGNRERQLNLLLQMILLQRLTIQTASYAALTLGPHLHSCFLFPHSPACLLLPPEACLTPGSARRCATLTISVSPATVHIPFPSPLSFSKAWRLQQTPLCMPQKSG